MEASFNFIVYMMIQLLHQKVKCGNRTFSVNGHNSGAASDVTKTPGCFIFNSLLKGTGYDDTFVYTATAILFHQMRRGCFAGY